MTKLNSPCLECPNKGCGSYHSKCEKYIDFRKKIDEENRIKDKRRRLISDQIDSVYCGIKRMKKWRKNKK